MSSRARSRALDGESGDEWRLAALLGSDVDRDVARVSPRSTTISPGRARIDSLEGKLRDAGRDRTRGVARPASISRSSSKLPVDRDPRDARRGDRDARHQREDPHWWRDARGLSSRRRRRAFHAPLRSKRACRSRRPPGLHHPLRAEYRLTYEADAPTRRDVRLSERLSRRRASGRVDRRRGDRACSRSEIRTRSSSCATRFAWRGHELRADQASDARTRRDARSRVVVRLVLLSRAGRRAARARSVPS